MLKKVLVAAGFTDIPVIAVSTSNNEQNKQPGFSIDFRELLKMGFWGILFGDALSKMYHSTIVRELRKGDSKRLVDKYTMLIADMVQNADSSCIFDLLASAVSEFNRIPVKEGNFPCIGLVGEIYVKYNDFSNNYIIDWLQKQGVEVDIPPLINFFLQQFVNTEALRKHYLRKRNIGDLLAFLSERFVQRKVEQYNRIMEGYNRFKPQYTIRQLSARASKIVRLIDQFGEGWLLSGEISYFAEQGVNEILCLQPFGCIANHIVAKGVEKTVRELYPQLNILYLDMDAGAGEANLFNRLHFILQAAKEQVGKAA
jgi:predicted nucleotide-binding protein (sugar kinase/HSP70/actin superfamily)